MAIIGAHWVDNDVVENNPYIIPIVDVIYPPNQNINSKNNETHDFAIGVLERPVKWSQNVQPICLPNQDQDFAGLETFAAGWGASDDLREHDNLQKVDLQVDKKNYTFVSLFGTKLLKTTSGVFKDPCKGDSGI